MVVDNVLNPYPYYYGSNIVYRGDMVYVNGTPYVSANEYYRQALELAQSATVVVEQQPIQVVEREVIREVPVQNNGPVLAPPNQLAADSLPTDTGIDKQTVAKPVADFGADWMPMGTFAFLADSGEAEKNRVIQLATNKEGQIRGNYVDEATGTVKQLVGAIDSKTQRVALKFVGEDAAVIECGLWNLTQETVPVLVHYSATEKDEQTLVRLTQTEDEKDANQTESDKKSEGGFQLDVAP